MTQPTGRTFHSDSRAWSNFQPGELVKLCGVTQGRWPQYVLKELVDNAMAALEDFKTVNPMIWINIGPDFISVSENGPGMDDRVLDAILDFDRFGGSNRHHKLPTRGAQGNAFMTVIGIVTAWAPEKPIGVERPSADAISIDVVLDPVRQVITADRTVVGEPSASLIEVPMPTLPWKRGGTTYEELDAMARAMAIMNPHITVVVTSSWKSGTPRRTMYPSEPGATQVIASSPRCGAAAWFKTDDFAARLAADVRARPDTRLRSWVSEFYGSPAAKKVEATLAGLPTDETIGDLTDGCTEAEFTHAASCIRSAVVKRADVKYTEEPKRLAEVGSDRLEKFLVEEMGADQTSGLEYRMHRGTFTDGDAKVPFVVEVGLLQMPAKTGNAPEVILCMNRTVLYGSPSFKGLRWREKVRGDWRNTQGDLNTLCQAYGITSGKTPCAVVVHVTCPSPGYSGYGKQQFDTSWLSEPISEAFERVTLRVRKQRAGEARRRGLAKESDASIRDTMFGILPNVIDKATEGGRLPILIRQLYYATRGVWAQHHHKDLQYGTFCAYVTEFETTIARRAVCLKDPRGTLIEPHSGRELRLGTDAVEKYNPKKWEGHTIIFVEKEGFAHLLKAYGVPKRYDAIIVGSKGFAVEACREVLQKYKRLLGDMVKIIALHDADPAGYMLGYDLATNLPRFGDNVAINVIDVGLTISEAQEMDLMDEPFQLKQSVWTMVKNMRQRLVRSNGVVRPLLESEAWDSFMPADLRYDEYPSWISDPKGRRIELNAMEPRVFVDWLERHLDANDCKKVRPPDAIVDEKLRHDRENYIRNQVGGVLMDMLGESMVHEIIGEIGLPSHDLDAVLSMKPEQHWSYIVEQAAKRGVDIKPLVQRRLAEKLGGGA